MTIVARPKGGAANFAGCANDSPRAIAAREALLARVGAELAALVQDVARLAGQVVMALGEAERACSTEQLALELGSSRSTVFCTLRWLQAAGVVERWRPRGTHHDTYTLRGKDSDVPLGRHLASLRRTAWERQALCRGVQRVLAHAAGPEAERRRARLEHLAYKYALLAAMTRTLSPAAGSAPRGP